MTEITTTNAQVAAATQAVSSCTWWRRACADVRWILSFIWLVFAQDGLLRETPLWLEEYLHVMALVRELFQTFPDSTLELENNREKHGKKLQFAVVVLLE